MRTALGGIVLSMAMLGCGRYQPTPVPVQGVQADIAALAGDWEGSYSSLDSRRDGTITFTITAGADSAFGDVLMVPHAGGQVLASDASSPQHLAHARSPELLRVTFVRIAGGRVQGALEPYVAPDCQCVVTTMFQGAATSDRIEGTYITTGRDGLRQEGRWSMRRAR